MELTLDTGMIAGDLFHKQHQAAKALVPVRLVVFQLESCLVPHEDCSKWCVGCPSFTGKLPGGGCPPNSPSYSSLVEKFPAIEFVAAEFSADLYPDYVKKSPGCLSRTLNYVSSPYMSRLLNTTIGGLCRGDYFPLSVGSCWVCRSKGGCAVKLGNYCRFPTQRLFSMESVGVRADLLLKSVFSNFSWDKSAVVVHRLIGIMGKKHNPSFSEVLRRSPYERSSVRFTLLRESKDFDGLYDGHL